MRQQLESQAMVQAHTYFLNRQSHIKLGFEPNDLNYTSVVDFVLDRGQAPVSLPLTEEQYEYLMSVVDNCIEESFPYKKCFYNSQVLLLADYNERLTYCEGYCQSKTLPVHHGWLELDGKVVDVTFSTSNRTLADEPQGDLRDRVLGTIPDGWEYLGVRFDRDEVFEFLEKYEVADGLIGNYRQMEKTFSLPRNKPRDIEAWNKRFNNTPQPQ